MGSKILRTIDLCAYFGQKKILKNVKLDIHKNKVTAVMGPSGCGKSTLIRCMNRMHEINDNATISGKIKLYDDDIYKMDPINLRKKIGMVFQRPNPFPTMSIYENVISGYKLNGIRKKKKEFNDIVEDSLKKAALWNEVKDDLHSRGTFLSGGQQQRLCIARAIAMKPEILLLDEPTSALDPKATLKIEALIEKLKNDITVIIVTHNMGQASRISDHTVFMYIGEMIEYNTTEKMFTVPKHKITEEYLTGKIG